jgi:DNA-binding response OmpR family regulator
MVTRHADCSVLIVEDDAGLSTALAETLRDEGYSVECARDGLDAINLLRAGGAHPDVILLDLMMPRMNGESFRAEQQRDPELAEIPVIVISAGGDSREKAEELEAAGYLPKPLDIDDLLETVDQHC